MFSEKLDFLMNLTNTTNSALANQIKIDASHISRLRRGERSALKNPTLISLMAQFFARHCEQFYQRKTLMDLFESDTDFEDAVLPELITKWLTDSKAPPKALLGASGKSAVIPSADSEPGFSLQGQKCSTAVYYGLDGKRKATMDFLLELLRRDKPTTFYALSEESMDWLLEDHAYLASWVNMMTQVFKKGCTLKIIHTVNRDLDEMLASINFWLPLYLHGTIVPYYYPKKRDGIYKRTLFIAPGIQAVASSIIGNKYDNAASFLFTDKTVLNTFEQEFDTYVDLCKPLMNIFTLEEGTKYLDALLEFERLPGDAIIKMESLSLLTIPDEVIENLKSRAIPPASWHFDYGILRKQIFEENIGIYAFTELIHLPRVEQVLAGEVKVSLSGSISGQAICYTPEEYLSHLRNIIRLLETHENFHVSFTAGPLSNELLVYTKENAGALVSEASLAPVIVSFNEDSLKTAFWDYMLDNIDARFKARMDNSDAAAKLRQYIAGVETRLCSEK